MGTIHTAGNAGKAGRVVLSSDIQATVVVNAVAADVSLPSVVVPAGFIPTGTSIQRVIAAVSWRKSVESSAVANAVNVAQNIQVRSDAPGTWRDAINIPDNSLAHDASATEPGFLIPGDNDISVEVTVADTYEFQWENADVDGASITFHDWQCFLIVEYA
jgi:hypothetical protein